MRRDRDAELGLVSDSCQRELRGAPKCTAAEHRQGSRRGDETVGHAIAARQRVREGDRVCEVSLEGRVVAGEVAVVEFDALE